MIIGAISPNFEGKGGVKFHNAEKQKFNPNGISLRDLDSINDKNADTYKSKQAEKEDKTGKNTTDSASNLADLAASKRRKH